MSEVTCPYCGAEDCYSDPWRLEPDSDHTIECDACEKEFICTPTVIVEYTSTRMECADDKHELGEWRRSDYTREMLEKYPWRDDKTPHSLWCRNCANCNFIQIEHVEFKADLPEHLKKCNQQSHC